MRIRDIPNALSLPQNSKKQLDIFFEEMIICEGAFNNDDFVKHDRKYSNALADKIANSEDLIIHAKNKEGQWEKKTVKLDAKGKDDKAWRKYLSNYNERNLPTFSTTDGEEVPFTKIDKTDNNFSGKAKGGVKSTEGKEVWQGIGFYIWGGIEEQFKLIREMIAKKENDQAAEKINSLKSFLYEKDIIDAKELPIPPDIDASEAKKISLMLNGSVIARKKLLAKDADFRGERIYVIRSSIKQYYSEMRRIGQPEGEIPKENTADIVVTNVPDLLSILGNIKDGQKDKISYNTDTGLCRYGRIKFMQVSLKMLEGKAPYGNIAGYVKNMTGITHEEGLSSLELKKKEEEISTELAEIYEPFQTMLQEGTWSYLGTIASKTYNTMKSALVAGKEFATGLIHSFGEAIKEFTQGIKEFIEQDQVKVEAEGFTLLKDELNIVLTEDKIEGSNFKKASEFFRYVKEKVDAKDEKVLRSYAKAITNLANKEKLELENSLNPNYMKLVSGIGIAKGSSVDVKAEDVVRVMLEKESAFALQYLYVNHLSFLTITRLIKMIKGNKGTSLKKAIEIFDNIRLTTSIGYTFLPLVRVYGGEGDPEILSYDNKDEVISMALFDRDKPYLVISIKRDANKGNYLVNVLPFAGIDVEKEEKNYTYMDFTFGSNQSSFVYNIVAYDIKPQEKVY